MGSFFTNVQGRPDDSGVRIMRRRIPYNTPGFSTAPGIPIGAIERGGVPIRAIACKNTAFSAGATITVGNVANASSGQAAAPAGFMASADVAPQTAGMSVVGNNTNPGGANIGAELPADTIVYALLAGTAPTAGDVTFILEYAPAYNWSDLAGGQAT